MKLNAILQFFCIFARAQANNLIYYGQVTRHSLQMKMDYLYIVVVEFIIQTIDYLNNVTYWILMDSMEIICLLVALIS